MASVFQTVLVTNARNIISVQMKSVFESNVFFLLSVAKVLYVDLVGVNLLLSAKQSLTAQVVTNVWKVHVSNILNVTHPNVVKTFIVRRFWIFLFAFLKLVVLRIVQLG